MMTTAKTIKVAYAKSAPFPLTSPGVMPLPGALP